MAVQYTNNARGYLAGAISASDTQLSLVSGGAARFPTLTAGNTFNVTLVSVDGGLEIVTVTAVAGDQFTVVRGAEGTTPRQFTANSLVELRITAGVINDTLADVQHVSEQFMEYRPGDAPEFFDVTNATPGVSVNGLIMRFAGAGTARGKAHVPVQPGDTYTFRVAYSRLQDSNDPANDGIRAGVDWYNGAGVKLSEQILHSNNNLLVSSGRVEFTASVGLPGVAGVDVYAPESARYATPWFYTFGANHQTDLEICGFIAAPNPAPLVVSAADLVIPANFKWPAGTIPTGAGVSDPYTVARTFYVTMAGSDANAGTSLSVPLATVGAALTKAAAVNAPSIVIVHPGEYIVQPDTSIPANCTLYGYDLRSTKLSLPPGLQENNMFRLDSGCKVRGFTFTNLQHEAYTLENGPPQKGYAFVFKPGALITRSPYISDCSQLHNFTQDQMSLPVDRDNGNPLMPRGGGNLYADGSVLAPSSPLRSVVVDSFTAINPNGVGYTITRNAFVQLVSVFTIANSNCTFGDYAFVSTGFRESIQIETPASNTYLVAPNVADLIVQNKADIIDEVYAQLLVEFVVVQNFTQEQEDLTRRDLNTLLTELEGDFRSGQDRGAKFFVKGLFNWNAQYLFSASLLPVFLRSYDIVEARILARPGVTTAQTTMLDQLINLIKTNLSTPNRTAFTSVIEANAQQFSYVGSGVNYNALPFSQRGTGTAINPSLAIRKVDGGRVYATYSTEVGDTYLGEDLRVDFERNTIEGQAFSRGVQNITLPLIIALGG
jgi:hypothetical protein